MWARTCSHGNSHPATWVSREGGPTSCLLPSPGCTSRPQPRSGPAPCPGRGPEGQQDSVGPRVEAGQGRGLQAAVGSGMATARAAPGSPHAPDCRCSRVGPVPAAAAGWRWGRQWDGGGEVAWGPWARAVGRPRGPEKPRLHLPNLSPTLSRGPEQETGGLVTTGWQDGRSLTACQPFPCTECLAAAGTQRPWQGHGAATGAEMAGCVAKEGPALGLPLWLPSIPSTQHPRVHTGTHTARSANTAPRDGGGRSPRRHLHPPAPANGSEARCCVQ